MRRARAACGIAFVCSACFDPVAVGDVPSGEPCIVTGERADATLYGAIVDGFASCPSWLRQHEDEQAILMFTGPAWNRAAASCRAAEPWYQKDRRNWAVTLPASELDLHGDGVQRPTRENGKLAPPTALGYCAVNEGEPDEYLVYSTCGIAKLGPGLCGDVLPAAADHPIKTVWYPCPNADDPRCAKSPVEHDCLPALDAIDGTQHARYVDSPYYSCSDGGDPWDSMIVSVAEGWDDPSFQCMSTQAWDRSDAEALQVKLDRKRYEGTFRAVCASQILIDAKGRSPPAPTRPPLGYCEVWPDTRYRYVVYSFCAEGDVDPRSRCLSGWTTTAGQAPLWHDCPEGELCFATSGPACGDVGQ